MDDPIRELLANAKTIAVIGLSSDPMRPSFGVSQYLQRKGYRIIPLNPEGTPCAGNIVNPALQTDCRAVAAVVLGAVESFIRCSEHLVCGKLFAHALSRSDTHRHLHLLFAANTFLFFPALVPVIAAV